MNGKSSVRERLELTRKRLEFEDLQRESPDRESLKKMVKRRNEAA